MMKAKKAQVEITFHWVYILIAGAVILLFFAGIVIRQKAVSEERLSEDVLNIMDSILIGAGVSEKTKNLVKTEGLSDYIFEFKCEEGYSGFGIQGGSFEELSLDPVFAPKEIKTTGLILWSLPYKLPYKVMDLLILSSINTKYFVIGGEGTTFRNELEKSVGKEDDITRFNFDFIESLDEVNPGKNFQVRIIDLNGKIIDGESVPENLKELGDTRVTAVSFSGKQATYFQKEGTKWKKLGKTIQIISIVEEKDAAKYAAIFAGDGESYQCNMMKVFKRMEFVNSVYEGKLKEMIDYYTNNFLAISPDCLLILEKANNNLQYVLDIDLETEIVKCNSGGYELCSGLASVAQTLKNLNGDLRRETCMGLY